MTVTISTFYGDNKFAGISDEGKIIVFGCETLKQAHNELLAKGFKMSKEFYYKEV